MTKTTEQPQGRMLVAKDTFVHRFQGADYVFTAGKDRVREGHPIIEGVEHLFEPIWAHYEIESATAAPGEKRG